jgi:hypothetical protein
MFAPRTGDGRMTEREAELRQLTAELRDHGTIEDAFLAKSFTDRLVIIDVGDGADVPADVSDRLAELDLQAAESVYGDDAGSSFAGTIGDATRHHFVDVQTRGSHRSYVLD